MFVAVDVLGKWKSEFSNLFNSYQRENDDGNSSHNQVSELNSSCPLFEDNISILEVKKAVDSAKRGKACGFDNIPSEVLHNDYIIYFLHILFNVCFNKGIVPSEWGKCIINPIPKSSSMDPRDPLSYRGIALASSVYKIYCSVINERLSRWVEDNDTVTDEQNGFRRKGSIIDHVSLLTSLIETRKKLKKSTFCAFIDLIKPMTLLTENNYGSGCLKLVFQENYLRL